MLYLIGGIALIIWGVLSLRAFALDKKFLGSDHDSGAFLFKKLLGREYNKMSNFLFGILEIVLGVICLSFYFK